MNWTEQVQQVDFLADADLNQFGGLFGNIYPYPFPIKTFCCHTCCRATAKGVQHHVSGIGRGLDDPVQEGQGFLGWVMESCIETIFMLPSSEYSYLSSSLIKEVYALGGDISGLVPEVVESSLRALDGSFRSVRYDIDEEEYLVVRQERDRYVATRHKYDFQLEEERVFGEIRTSLTEALISQGEKYALVFKVLDILGWDLDFTQLQPQDSFTLLVEKKYRAGRFVKYGDVLAVRFDQMDRSLFGFLFTDPATGKEDYFDEKGNSLRKAFLRVPFKFDPRITSGFSYSRYHPVLKRRRPHLGVDYGAPTGTEVLSVAAGTVSFAGRNGGYGKMVRIRHVKFSTSYAHLSRIQVRRGQRVEQGDVVGRVGSTGLSTGPHLDYRIQDRSGRYLNPAKLKFPPEKPVAPQHLDAFRGARNDLMQRLSLFPANAEYFTRKAKSG